MYGNTAKNIQMKSGTTETPLISGASIRDSYYIVSKSRCDGYLSEFPIFSKHFEKFAGKTSGEFSRADLLEMFKELSPSAEEAIPELSANIGILKPTNKEHAATASNYNVPRLYISGLGITTKGRP
jgi:hypothetical protein